MNKIIVTYREGANDKPDWWELFRPLFVQLSNGEQVCIPSGYVTDFASVPSVLWSVCPPIGKYNRAALIHDFLYDKKYKESELGEYEARKFADYEFLKIANNSDPESKIRHYLMFVIIRLFGKNAWRSAK